MNDKIGQRFAMGPGWFGEGLRRWKGYMPWRKPSIHVVLGRPSGEKEWPIPLPKPVVEETSTRTLETMYSKSLTLLTCGGSLWIAFAIHF